MSAGSAPRFAVVSCHAAPLLLELLRRRGVDLADVAMSESSLVRDARRVANGAALAEAHAQLEAAAADYIQALRDRTAVQLAPVPSGRLRTTGEARELLAGRGVAVGVRRVRSLSEEGAPEGARPVAGRWVVPEWSVLTCRCVA